MPGWKSVDLACYAQRSGRKADELPVFDHLELARRVVVKS